MTKVNEWPGRDPSVPVPVRCDLPHTYAMLLQEIERGGVGTFPAWEEAREHARTLCQATDDNRTIKKGREEHDR